MATLLSDAAEDLNGTETSTVEAGTSSTYDAIPAAPVPPASELRKSARPQTGCPKCGSQESWGAASWCPECGYYPTFDKLDAEATPSEETEAEAGPQSAWEAVPGWVWVLAGGCAAIFVGSVAAKLMIPAESPYLVLLTLLQTVVGGIAALVAHIAAYMLAIQKSDKYSPLDLVINPVEIWRPTLAKLPLTRRRVCLVAWGMTAVFCATAILGGYDINSLFEDDWADAQPQRNLLQEIVKQAREERDSAAGSLEDAMNQFVGEAEPPVAEIPKIETDCLIMGFTKHDRGAGFGSILLAAVPPGGKLSFVGTMLAEELPEEVRELLAERMPPLARTTPFVHVSYDAVWLRPVLMCRISHEAWTAGNLLKVPEFQKMLKDVDVEGR